MHHIFSALRLRFIPIVFAFFFFILFTHIAFADTLPNPLMLNNGVTGGDCTLVGTWSASTKTCTLTQDIHGSGIVLYSGSFGNNNGVVLDGAGHIIFGQGVGVGVDLNYISNPTVKNITIDGFSTSIGFGRYGGPSNDATVQNVTISNTGTALSIYYATRPSIYDIVIQHASTSLQAGATSDLVVERITGTDAGGIRLSGDAILNVSPTLKDITINGNNVSLAISGTQHATLRNVHLTGTVSTDFQFGFWNSRNQPVTDSNNDIDTSNTINGKPIMYWNHAHDTTLDASGAFAVVCMNCDNVEIKSANLLNTNTGIYLYKTTNSLIHDNVLTGSQLYLVGSSNNTLTDNTLTTYQSVSGLNIEPAVQKACDINGCWEILEASSTNNTFYRNSFDSRYINDQYDTTDNNHYFKGMPDGGNYWSMYDTPAEGCNDTNNDHICDQPFQVIFSHNGYSTTATDDHPWNIPPVPQCSDGVDDDGDGKTDAADSGCHSDHDATNAASYDATITNEDFLASQYPIVKQITAQLTYSTSTPQGTASNLIVLVHGCCNSKSDVQETWDSLKNMIEPAIIQNSAAGQWEVLVWDWSSSTPKDSNLGALAADGYVAYVNAFDQGNVLGERIRAGHYKFVHFVGHSAGSNLIDSAVRDIKTAGGADHPIIHTTFLDAFAPFGSYKTYGGALESADFAEQYVHTGDLPSTNSTLPHAYNFDVTQISGVNPLDLTGGHSWPIEFYRQSSVNAGTYGFGLPLSFERSNQGTSSTFYVNEKQALLSNRNIRVGDVCLLTSTTACTANPLSVVQQVVNYTQLGVSKIVGGVAGIKKSITGVVDLIVGALPTDIVAVLYSGSPVWFEIPLNTTEPYNTLQFTYEFLSAAGAEGVMTVFVDDNPVYKIDERITSAGTTTTPSIPVGDLAVGRHMVSFRLDPFTDVQSSARITSIQLGLIKDQQPTDTIKPTTPTSLLATPTGTSTIRLTWATSTDNVGIAQYRIFRATSSSATTTLIATTTASTTSYVNRGLTASTTYWYQVRAVDLAGNVSSSSSKVSTTTQKVVTSGDSTAPSIPKSFTATAASSTQINLAWATSTDNVAVVGYKVERCTGSTCTNFVQVATSTVTNYKNTNLAASTTYRFRVRAYDAAGNNSLYSSTTKATTLKNPQTIFSDSFESALNWTKVGAVTWYTGTPKNGTHAVRLQTTANIDKAISLANYSNVTVSFKMGANSLDTASENVQAMYYNGTSWVTLATIANNSANENNLLNPYTFTLPASMNNSAAFKLRFKINGSDTTDSAFIDDVKVVGTPK